MDCKCKKEHKQNNVITVTNNNVKYYENLANQYSKEAANSVIKAASYAKSAEEYLKSCQNLKETIDEETMQLVSMHSENYENPHQVNSEQVGAYSKTETEDLLSSELAKKNPNLAAGKNIVITDNEDGTQTIESSNTVSMDYSISENKPLINSVALEGNKTSHDFGLASLEDLPVNVSELVNDTGYLTEHQDLSSKQDVLISGAGISIDDNVISTVNRADTDLSNLSDVGERSLKDSIMNNIMPDYSAGVELSVLTTDQVIQKNGWIFVSSILQGNFTAEFYINDELVFCSRYNASSGTGGSSGFIPIYKGDKYKCNTTTRITNLVFYPMKGVV